MANKKADYYFPHAACPRWIRRKASEYAHLNLADRMDEAVRKICAELVAECKGVLELNGFTGLVTPGGTGSNELALHLAREHGGEVVIGSSLNHVSIAQSCDKLGMKFVSIGRNADNSEDFYDRLLEKIKIRRRKISCVVLASPEPNFGMMEGDIPREVERYCLCHGIGLHIDAAYGMSYAHGTDTRNDFLKVLKSHAVQSITFDNHKMIGVNGCSISFIKNSLFKRMKYLVPYFRAAPEAYFGTTCSPYAMVASHLHMKDLGEDGLRKRSDDFHNRAAYLSSLLSEREIEPFDSPAGRIVTVQVDTYREMNAAFDEMERSGMVPARAWVVQKSMRSLYGLRVVTSMSRATSRSGLEVYADRLKEILG